MNEVPDNLKDSMITIATEIFRFERVFYKAISKLDSDEHNKYLSQFNWFYKQIKKVIDDFGLKIINVDGKAYNPGLAVMPLNIDEFKSEDNLIIEKTIEPLIMYGNTIIKTGIVILGRID